MVWGWLLNALKHGADLVNFPSSLAIDYNSMQQQTWARKVPEMLLTSTAGEVASAVLCPGGKRSRGGICPFMQ